MEQALPALRAGRTARAVDWELIDRLIGVRHPADLRELAGRYPTLSFGEYLLIGLPDPGREREFVEGHRGSMELLAEYIAEGQVPPRYGSDLVQLGSTIDGDVLWWWPAPERVVVMGHGGGWWEYDLGVVAFLTEVFAGRLDVPVFPRAAEEWGQDVGFHGE
ncbi:hypothetical protein ACGFX4_40385 [Kitasatospora sp. NPDC048365]|uniref:hypothetical protein n=1 Tax=Kitasatospora sp. NPDC048365 TaxID=3364050 RepID=UPI003712082D